MSTAIATTPKDDRNTLMQLLESRKSAMQAVLPKHLTPDRLIKIAGLAVSRSELLQKCTPLSVLQSVMTAAQLGLDVGGSLGSAYLVPFKRNKKDDRGQWHSHYECQLIIGYRGLIDLARRSGQIANIEARVVYQNDVFDVEYDADGVRMKHKPVLDADPGELRLVYAIATLKDGGRQFELMTRTQVEAIRAKSQAKDNGPWVTDFDEMARKTVVKRLAKYLPISVELADGLTRDNATEFGDNVVAGEVVTRQPVERQLPAGKLSDVLDVRDGREGEELPPIDLPDGTVEAPSDDADVSTWPAFVAAMERVAMDRQVPPSEFERVMKWVELNTVAKSAKRDAVSVRQSLYADFREGKPIGAAAPTP